MSVRMRSASARVASTADSLPRIWLRAAAIAASLAATLRPGSGQRGSGTIDRFGLVVELLLRDERLSAQIGETLRASLRGRQLGLTLHPPRPVRRPFHSRAGRTGCVP
jgi:hypothetical protein